MPPKTKTGGKGSKKKAKQEIKISTQAELEQESKLLEFWRLKIREAFSLYVKDRPNQVESKYIPNIMR